VGERQLDALAAPFGCRLAPTVDLVALAVDEPGCVVPDSIHGHDHVSDLAGPRSRAVYCIPMAELIHVETPLAGATPNGMQNAKGRYLGNGFFAMLIGKEVVRTACLLRHADPFGGP
jgi:hypothetical protein